MPALMQSVKRLRDRWLLPPTGTVSVKDLNQRFQPAPAGSMLSLLAKMNMLADVARPVGGSTRPYYRRTMPAPQNVDSFTSDTTHIDLTNAHMPAYPSGPVELSAFNLLFDKRAAAAVSDAVGNNKAWPGTIYPFYAPELLEYKSYGDAAPSIKIPKVICLAEMAFPDYFPDYPHLSADERRSMVSDAILAASPGWCGSFGPGVDSATDVADIFEDHYEGNYDLSEMHLLPIAYRYYDELSPEARERLITGLLAGGRVHRPRVDETFTSGITPNDWSRAGFITPSWNHIRIGETENHILLILTARYLTNQLFYQRDHDLSHDNRRNGTVFVADPFGGGSIPVQVGPHCTELVLELLRNILRDDFSEYNAKPYQHETRTALLNLCNYAYDHEVRLAAQMVLDYISAHIAVSSNDLRRMVPFRRRNETDYRRVAQLPGGFMDVGLLEWFLGADPMAEHFAMQAGNLRAYEHKRPPADNARPWDWAIASDGGDATLEVLSDYRLPPSIHDLFVNDLHRRYFQRLHRFIRYDEVAGTNAVDGIVGSSGRNADNMEIYAGSPSYLITAGGEPATYAVDPYPATLFPKGRRLSALQLGVAMPTSFMPTGQSAGPDTQNGASDLIQFSNFSDKPGEVANYGVAPDFACGHKIHLPFWVLSITQLDGQFLFVDRGSAPPVDAVMTEPAGFYLAIYDDGYFSFLEAFDTWLHPGVTFQDFKRRVKETNPSINIQNNVESQYTTQNGNRLHFVIWKDVEREGATDGAKILRIEYGAGDPTDRLLDPLSGAVVGDAGNITDKFLSGTIMNSPAEAVVEITNPILGTKITLDMSDQRHPRRTSETGEVEEAGSNHEVWVNFGWTGPNEGDFFRPFNTITGAAAAVADGGVIKIMPGWTTEKPSYQRNKRIRLVAPIGGVTFGVR